MGKNEHSKRTKWLIVEGHSDFTFYQVALRHLKREHEVYFNVQNGKDVLLPNLTTLLADKDLLGSKESIGVILDADGSAANTQASVVAKIKAATGVNAIEGKWVSTNPKIGFFIAPGKGSAGEIETLAWQAWAGVAENQAAKDCIESYIACMSANERMAKSPDKGKISAMLAIANDDDPRLGPGSQKNIFDFSRPEFKALLDFLSGI